MKKIYLSIVFMVSIIIGNSQSNLISYLSNPSTPQTRALDYSKKVGATKWDSKVTPFGNADYYIPIFTPQGTSGIEPNISISYNSGQQNNVVGYGWSLNGISSIKRAGSNYFSHLVSKEIQLSNDDHFVLDGVELILTNPTPAPISTYTYEFKTKENQFNIVKRIIDNTRRPSIDYFIAYTKDGLIKEYGKIDNAKNGLEWKLTKEKDQNGNYIEYNYTKIGNELVLSEINYTGYEGQPANLTPYNSIKFYYKDRTDTKTEYIAGVQYNTTQILEKINILNNNTIAKEYYFAYFYDEYMFSSKLYSIQESDGNGISYNKTLIDWGHINNTASSVALNQNYGVSPKFSGDLNGDGVADLIITKDIISLGKHYWDIDVYLSNGTGGFTSIHPNIKYHNEYTNLSIGDYNSDGIDEFVISDYLGLEFYKLQGNSIVSYRTIDGSQLMDASGLDRESALTQYAQMTPYYELVLKAVAVDLTGNGRNEIIFYDKALIYRIEDMYGVALNIPYNVSGIPSNDGCPIKLSDFNGNGKVEIIYNEGYGTAYEYNNSTAEFDAQIQNIPSLVFEDGSISDDYNASIVDLNGDGKSDILYYNNSGMPSAYIYTGSGFVSLSINIPSVPWQPIDPIPGMYSSKYATDKNINNDQYVDLIINGTVYYNTGIIENGVLQVGSITGSGDMYNLYADFNGDGTLDLCNGSTLYLSGTIEKNLVKVIYDGFNNYVKFEYKTLANDNEYSKSTGACLLSERNFIGPMNIVKDRYTSDGIGGQKHDHYKYYNARINLEGLGFIGFEKTELIMSNGITQTSYYNRETKFTNNGQRHFVFNIFKNESYLTANNAPIAKTEISYSSSFSLNEEQIFTYPTLVTAIDYLTDKKSTTSYDYSTSTGNVSSEVRNFYKNSTGSLTFTSDMAYSYSSIQNWHVPSLKTFINKKDIRTGKTPTNEITKYEYDTKGVMTSNTSFLGSPNEVVVDYSDFNNFGLAQKITTTAASVSPRITAITYDSRGRFITSLSNGIGTVYETHDPVFGIVLSETNVDGLTQTNAIDGFGNIISSKDIFGVIATSNTAWVSSGQIPNSPNAIYKVTKNKSNAFSVVEVFDIFGRNICNIKKITQVANGQIQDVYSFIQYNNSGQVYRKSKDCVNPNPALIEWNNYTYDVYGRIASEQQTNRPLISYTYQGSSTTMQSTNANIYSKKTFDPTGVVVESKDNGGTVQFDYNSQNKPIKITTNDLVIEKAYDIAGNLILEKNPNKGEYNYKYNALGELTQRLEPDGNITINNYDSYGRLLEESNGSNVKNFVYKSASPGLGKMELIQLSNGTSAMYEYNNYGQVSEYSQIINNHTFLNSFKYNNAGKLSSRTFPSGYIIDYTYDAVSGLLTTVNDETNGGHISKIDFYNNNMGFGTPESIILGDHLNASYNYDYNVNSSSYNMLTGIAYKDGNGNDLWAQAYTFDNNTGNLLDRRDILRNLRETFSYDNLNRLTSYNNPFTGDIGNSYSENGNITKSDDLGEYSYDATRKNAVVSIENNTHISKEEQHTEYTYFDKIKIIQQGAKQTLFDYGFDYQRRYMSYTDENGETTETYYLGDYEYIESPRGTKELHYINSANGLDAIYVINDNAGAERGDLYFVAKDYLGSISALFDHDNNLVDENSFDPWGRKRNPDDWSFDLNYKNHMPIPDLTNRGYTGHEHLIDYQLINMNGRMYDPITKQMTSPDIFDQSTYFTQSYNRYSYVLNNPMKYVDPSGYYWRFNKFVVSIETAIDGSTDPTYSRHAEYVWVTELELAWWAGLNSVDGGYVGGAGVSSGGGGGGVGGNYPGDVDQSDGGDGDNRGQVISFANGAAAYGFGVMGDIGAVVDSYGNSKLYLTVGGVIGYGAAAGMGYSRTGRYTSMDDFSGLAGGISLSGRKSPVSIEGYYDISHGAVRDYYGTNLYGGGINVGVGKGWFKYMSYTITFDPPSRDFWIHPATKR